MFPIRFATVLSVLWASWSRAHVVDRLVAPPISIKHNLEERNAAIGIDLSASYGAVAITLNNGTHVPIARIEADDEYKGLMKEMSEGDGRGPPWPGSPNEFPVFRKMLAQLCDKAESFLGYKVEAVLAATPNLPGERSSYLHKAIESLGLKDLDNSLSDSQNSFRQTAAAEAASGFGLCRVWRDVAACNAENLAMPKREVISILYTNNSLCVEASSMGSVYGYYSYRTEPTSMDFTLGYAQRNNNPDQKYYWSAVKERITKGTLGIFPLHTPEMVFLYGEAEAVRDKQLWNTIDDAMMGLLGKKLPIYAHDPVFAVAKGASEIARRGTWPYRNVLTQKAMSGLLIQSPLNAQRLPRQSL